MRRLSFLLVSWCLLTNLAFCQQPKQVHAGGWGETPLQATNEALRQAVEKSCGVEIFSETVVKNFVVLKDTLITESFGFISQYQIRHSQFDPQKGLWFVKVEALVSKKVSSEFEKVKTTLLRQGLPRIAIKISETCNNKPSEQLTILLSEELQKLGFRVLVLGKTKTENLPELILKGQWQCTSNTTLGPGDIKLRMNKYQLASRIFRSDTRQMVAAVQKNHQTVEDALVPTTQESSEISNYLRQEYIPALLSRLLTFWCYDFQQGQDCTLVIDQITFGEGQKLIQMLSSWQVLSCLRLERYTNNKLFLFAKCKVPLPELAYSLSKLPSFPLQVIQVSKNVVRLQVKNSQRNDRDKFGG